MATRTLDQLQLHDRARIQDVAGDDAAVSQRLLSLGVLPGADICVVSIAPLGDPITIEGKTGRISLRRNEARAVVLENDANLQSQPKDAEA